MKIKKIADVKKSAHALIAKFQMGQITKDELYTSGVELTLIFNDLMDNAVSDPSYSEAKDTASLLNVIKHFSTC